MKDSLFRLAVVGAGMITRGSHLPAALASPRVEVTAIVDPVVGRAAELARDYGINPRIVSRVEEVLDVIDGAVIATPNDSHRALGLACLEAGVPVLIEKPLASTYQEGMEIVRAAEAAGRVLSVGYSTRFRDNVLLLKTLLDEEYFGAIRQFAHQFGTAGGWAPFSAYNLDRAAAGGGVLVVTGTHFLDRMLYFWGYPRGVTLEDDALGGPEANCIATFAYASSSAGFNGVARYSKTIALPAGMVIETERGYVVLRDTDNADISFREHAKPDIEQVIRNRPSRYDPRSVFQRQLEDFVDACRDNRPPRVDGRQGAESLRLIEQLYSSRRLLDRNWYGEAVGLGGQ